MARQMKDSGVEWIGQIPEDWDVARLCDIKSEKKFAIVDGPFGSAISTNDYREKGVPLIRISNLKNGEVSDEDMVYISEELAESVRRSCIGLSDIVFAKTGATIGKCGINRLIKYGILASSCIKISISHKYNCDYFYYIFSTDQFNQALRNTCTGTTRDTINLTPFSKLNVLLPPYCIQNRIASYLDRKCRQIDAIIARQQEAIERLKSYKLSKINEIIIEVEGVTAHLGYVANMKNGLNFNMATDGKTLKFLGVGDFKDYYVLDSEEMFSDILIDTEIDSDYMIQSGDIVFVRSNGSKELVGRAVMVENVTFPLSYSGFCIRLRNLRTDILNSKYLLYFFRSPYFRKQLEKYSQGSNITNINQVILSQIPIIIPPVEVQLKAIRKVEKMLAAIDKLIKGKQEIISSLERYKKSLIYEVVTGKKEV